MKFNREKIFFNEEINNKPFILIETALLGRGLPSISNKKIKDCWPKSSSIKLVWVKKGELALGSIDEFLSVRHSTNWERVSSSKLLSTFNSKKSSFLTASSIMYIAYCNNIKYVVTAGMGGIREGKISDDLICLTNLPVILVAASPKDSQEIDLTIDYLKKNNVTVLGYNIKQLNGFLFKKYNIHLEQFDEKYLDNLRHLESGCLLLNPIKMDEIISSQEILKKAVNKSVDQGNKIQFHPLVNKYLDEFTNGIASEIQLNSLIANINTAVSLLGKE